MADKKVDGVIEAVHYAADGQVDWVRAYLRRGPTWSDRVILKRQDLIHEIKSGRSMAIGQRVQYMAGTFDISGPLMVSGPAGREVLVTSSSPAERDTLEGVPVL